MKLSPYISQVISPTGNDYLRLRVDPARPALHYFRILEDTHNLFCFTEAKLAYECTKDAIGLDIKKEELDKRLKRTAAKIWVFEQEKGLESCFITIGTLAWQIGESTGHAPIARIPCNLVNKGGNWWVTGIEYEELEVNPMLSYLLHGVGIEGTPNPTDAVDPFIKIEEINDWLSEKIQSHKLSWTIDKEPAYFGCFTYNGIPLEEVTPENFQPPRASFWFEDKEQSGELYEEKEISLEIPQTILPSDSSQLNVLTELRKGKSLVIQGPPGTGKSQTIVNIIADAIKRGKKIAFIAQKETALNVVYNRLPPQLKQLSIRLYQAEGMPDRTNLFTQLSARLNLKASNADEAVNNVIYTQLEGQMDSYGEFLCTGTQEGFISNYNLMARIIALQEYQAVKVDGIPTQLLEVIEASLSRIGEIEKLHTFSYPHWAWLQNIEASQIRSVERIFGQYAQKLKAYPTINIKDLKSKYQYYLDVKQKQEQLQRLQQEIHWAEVNNEQLKEACTANWLVRLSNKWIRIIVKDKRFNREKILQSLAQIESLTSQIAQVNWKELEATQQIYTELKDVLETQTNWGLPDYPDTTSIGEFLEYIKQHWQKSTNVTKVNILLNQILSYCPTIHKAVVSQLFQGQFNKQSLEKGFLEAIATTRQFKYQPGQMQVAHKSFREYYKKQYQNYCIQFKTPSIQELKEGNSQRVADKEGYALIRHVAKTTKARISVRHLIDRALPEMLELCPCWFLTPSKMAQNLPRTLKLFDLIIIDEASQLLKGEAMGSLARGKQFAILGDSQQMPPSVLMREEMEDDSLEDKRESILDWAASNLVGKSLLYHYRSEHHSLIAFSNDRFYGGNLYCIPSQKDTLEYGVKHHYIAGKYKPKGGDPNIIEAEKVIQEVETYIQKHPDRSIGIVTFNIRQQETLERLFDELRINNPLIQEYCLKHHEKGSGIFIKNLETVQGDERDTMFISTVFGPDQDTGIVYQRFGLNREGDEKRINVLITRAKKENIVITSLKPEDITSKALGPTTLRSYIEYAQTGFIPSPLHPENATTVSNYFDSPWEKWFYDRLTQDGFEVENQVGVGKWRIDLAIRGYARQNNTGFVCGIELDGAAYHSSLLARERDALRQDVLERHGWNILRVWSTDFFFNPEGEYQALKQKITTLCQT